MRTSYLTALRSCLIFAVCASIAGCGIRPSQLEMPDRAPGKAEYPRTYPNPATDPQP